ncbi:glycine-rich RNA-binding protein 2-like [Forsythia ovata]|uniref:Glycine-rich RNA-binding protein 2-like n=1 Tax=Forsythia ovata TaxID=205694 RepID=A0ABD1VMG5_9LAMI
MASGDVEFRCFVGGLAWATTDQSLEQAFSQFGEVIESKEWLAHYLDHTWSQRSSQIDKDSSRVKLVPGRPNTSSRDGVKPLPPPPSEFQFMPTLGIGLTKGCTH